MYTIHTVCTHIRHDVSCIYLGHIVHCIYCTSRSFRTGQATEWQQVFTSVGKWSAQANKEVTLQILIVEVQHKTKTQRKDHIFIEKRWSAMSSLETSIETRKLKIAQSRRRQQKWVIQLNVIAVAHTL